MTFLLVAAAALLLVSLASFLLAVHPPRIAVPLRPSEVGLAVEDVRVRASDGVVLAGWRVPRPGAPAIVLLHGYPAEKADLLPFAAALATRFEVVLMDLRYFGASGGRVTTLGVRERDDLRRTVDEILARGAPAVGVFGFSLGGAVALLTAAEDPRIGAVAAYAPFADLRALAHELYGWMWLGRYPFVWLMTAWGRLFLGLDLGAVSPAAAARAITAPVLVLHSRLDEQIPVTHAERLRAALAGNARAEVAVLDLGRHGELSAGFIRRVADFFDKHLGEARPRPR